MRNTLQVSMKFDIGGDPVNGTCVGGQVLKYGDLRPSIDVITRSGITVQVSLLQFANIDGKKTDVKASLNETIILIETSSFTHSMEYDPGSFLEMSGYWEPTNANKLT